MQGYLSFLILFIYWFIEIKSNIYLNINGKTKLKETFKSFLKHKFKALKL